MKNIFNKRLKNIFSVLLLFYIGLLVLSCKAQFMGDIMGRIDEIYSSNIYFCPSSLNLDTYVCESYQIGEEVFAEDLPTSVDDSRFSSFKPGYYPVVFQNLVDSSYTIGSYTLVCSAKAEDSSNVIATKSYTIAVVY